MPRSRRYRAAAVLALPLALAAAYAAPAAAAPPSVPGEVVVRFAHGTDARERAAARRAEHVRLERTLPLQGVQLVHAPAGRSAAQAAAALERRGDVLYAEPNFIRRAASIPDDTSFGSQWGLNNTGQDVGDGPGTPDADIDAPEAWDITTGSPSVTVAVVDSGVRYSHPDLAPNIWSNAAETPANAIDDDGNGLVDDTRGWDWVAGDADPADENGHGTHVAGTIGARGNDGYGIAGVAWQTSLMPLRALDANGSGNDADIASAFTYAAVHGAKVLNASLGGPGQSQVLHDAIAGAPDTLFVVAAGNNSSNNDVTPSYPCADPSPNLICVAATNQRDALASFSSFGRTTVDLGAPGTSVLSTYWGTGDFAYLDGTSMAAPHVSGTAALVLAAHPGWSTAQVRQAILAGVDPKPGLVCTTVSGGRLNAYRAVSGTAGPAPGICPAVPTSGTKPNAQQPLPRPAPQPSLSVTLSRQRLRTALRRGVHARVSCVTACQVTSSLLLGARAARRYRIPVSFRFVMVGSTSATVAAGRSATVTVRFTREARRRLQRARRLAVTLRTQMVGAVGLSERGLTLRR